MKMEPKGGQGSDNDIGKNAKVVENLVAQRCFSFDVTYIVQTVINLDGGQVVEEILIFLFTQIGNVLAVRDNHDIF